MTRADRLQSLQVLTYGIGITTMEEVFLKVAHEGQDAADAAAKAAHTQPPPYVHTHAYIHTCTYNQPYGMRVNAAVHHPHAWVASRPRDPHPRRLQHHLHPLLLPYNNAVPQDPTSQPSPLPTLQSLAIN